MDIALSGSLLPFDVTIKNGDFLADKTLCNAIYLSLFTDRRVSADELPDGVTSRRGWFGDLLSDIEGDEIGSRLWLLERDKINADTATRARAYAIEALDWLIEDGLADSVNVEAETSGDAVLISVKLTQGDKAASYDFTLKTKGV